MHLLFVHVFSSLPRKPFLELLLTQRSRMLAAKQDPSVFYVEMMIQTNNTMFQCCQLDWLYLQGLKTPEIQDMVRVFCVITVGMLVIHTSV
jgi:hypothetical protein